MVFIGRCKDGMPALSRLQVAGCRLPVDKFRLGSVVDRVGFQARDSLSGELALATNPGAPLALGPSHRAQHHWSGMSQ